MTFVLYGCIFQAIVLPISLFVLFRAYRIAQDARETQRQALALYEDRIQVQQNVEKMFAEPAKEMAERLKAEGVDTNGLLIQVDLSPMTRGISPN